MSASFASLMRLNEALVGAGFPPLTTWWREQFARLYDHPTAKTLVVSAGRGAIKSGAGVEFAANETACGDFHVPPGERHWFSFASENMSEARSRLPQVEARFGAMGVRNRRVGDTIELLDMPRGVRVHAATVGAVSGFRCIGWVADEAAKWTNADGSANPAADVIASIRAMTVTHPNARGLILSSPVGMADYHYKVVQEGDTDRQLVCRAPTWIANPSITEAQTHALEPDLRIWAREYLAEPQAAALAAFDSDAVARAFEPRSMRGMQRAERVLVCDPSSGKVDSWSWAIVGWTLPDETDRYIRLASGNYSFRPDGSAIERTDWKPGGKPFLSFDRVDAIAGKFWGQTSADDIVRFVAGVAQQAGASVAHSDQRESLALESLFKRQHMRFVVHDWTAQSKPRAVEHVRRWFRDGVLALPQHETLRKELAAFEEKIGPPGPSHSADVAPLTMISWPSSSPQPSPTSMGSWNARPRDSVRPARRCVRLTHRGMLAISMGLAAAIPLLRCLRASPTMLARPEPHSSIQTCNNGSAAQAASKEHNPTWHKNR